MQVFIEAWANNTLAYLNTSDISRISFAKKEGLKESERETKVQFKDGSTGTYVTHRKMQKLFAATLGKAIAGESTEASEE